MALFEPPDYGNGQCTRMPNPSGEIRFDGSCCIRRKPAHHGIVGKSVRDRRETILVQMTQPARPGGHHAGTYPAIRSDVQERGPVEAAQLAVGLP